MLQAAIIACVACLHKCALRWHKFQWECLGLGCELPGQRVSNIVGRPWNVPELRQWLRLECVI
eukprot:12566191-Alexandrium_andersonii.AAC.1